MTAPTARLASRALLGTVASFGLVAPPACVALIGLTTMLGACRSTTTTTTTDATDGISFRTIARGYQSAIAGEGVTVVRDADAWRALWNRHTASELPRPDAPAIDFAKEMVVCVTLGQRPTFGYAIEIVRVSDGADAKLVVETRDTRPAKDAILNQVITQPYHMIATPRRDGVEVVLAPR